MSADFPLLLPVMPARRPVRGVVTPPGSKSITNRALVLAALSSVARPVELRGCLRSEDTEVMLAALRQLGFAVREDRDDPRQVVSVQRGQQPVIPARQADLFVANSGTTMRFLTAAVSL